MGRNASSTGEGPDTRRAELRESFIDDAKLRIDELEKSLGATTADRRFLPLACRVRLLAAQDRYEEGMKLLRAFADEQQQETLSNGAQAKLYLQLGNLCSSVEYHEDAERWYRRLAPIAPGSYVLLVKSLLEQHKTNEAIDVCLRSSADDSSPEVATVLAQILSSMEPDAKVDPKAKSIIASALQRNGKNVDLLMSIAVLQVTRNRNDKAIELFKRIVDVSPNHTLALNNLATLLAEKPNQLKEAEEYVKRAIAIDGRKPSLLDTLGTVFIRTGKYPQAIAALEESVAGTAADPRYHFHLAVAYQRSGRKLDAQQALHTAQQLGLEQVILTQGDRELLTSLERDLVPSAATN